MDGGREWVFEAATPLRTAPRAPCALDAAMLPATLPASSLAAEAAKATGPQVLAASGAARAFSEVAWRKRTSESEGHRRRARCAK